MGLWGGGAPTQVQQPELAAVSVASLRRVHGAERVERHQGLDSASHVGQKNPQNSQDSGIPIDVKMFPSTTQLRKDEKKKKIK